MNKYLYYVEIESPQPHAEILMATDYDGIPVQSYVQKLFEDPAVMRVYRLEQCYAIGKVRGQ